MKIIANNGLGAQVKKRPTTSQGLLWELNAHLPVSMIVLHTGLTREQIRRANEGEQDLRVYTKLICLWALLDTNREKYADLEQAIYEKETELTFFPCPDNREISNYADKHG
jgi:hypothetical protein